MNVPFLRVQDHWSQSAGIDHAAIAFSAMSRGDSPVVTGTQSINFVIDGLERYEIDGRSHIVRPGEFLFLDAGTSARAVLPQTNATLGLCIFLPTTAATPALATSEACDTDPLAARSFQFAASATPYGRMLRRLGLLLATGHTPSAATSAAVMRRTLLEFEAMQSTLSADMLKIDAAKPGTRRDVLQRVYRARTYLHDRLDRVVPLHEVASAVGMSQFHLARCFRGVIGMPPMQYHATVRLQHADRLLRAGRLSITEASERFGFSEVSSFSRAFGRVIGISPREAMRGREARPRAS